MLEIPFGLVGGMLGYTASIPIGGFVGSLAQWNPVVLLATVAALIVFGVALGAEAGARWERSRNERRLRSRVAREGRHA